MILGHPLQPTYMSGPETDRPWRRKDNYNNPHHMSISSTAACFTCAFVVLAIRHLPRHPAYVIEGENGFSPISKYHPSLASA